jgi:2-polyprenyl-3-methyl-5-hydroxy-6-metoxy-1,4-benzoquinol methylase
MNFDKSRDCPICGLRANSIAFPFTVKFNQIEFNYLKCDSCSSIFVDPIPDDGTFALMYLKDSYHDCNYHDENSIYVESVNLLIKYVDSESIVLDYGCGLGNFLEVLSSKKLIPYGVEFDNEAAKFAANKADCKVCTVDEFMSDSFKQKFDAIHLGDVLEHLPNPIESIDTILNRLKPGGVFFVEGPLETNPSPVYWAIVVFGFIKHLLKPGIVPNNPPHHLIRIGPKQQLTFFEEINTSISPVYWRVYESGWPYIGGGIVKGAIAKIAIFFAAGIKSKWITSN